MQGSQPPSLHLGQLSRITFACSHLAGLCLLPQLAEGPAESHSPLGLHTVSKHFIGRVPCASPVGSLSSLCPWSLHICVLKPLSIVMLKDRVASVMATTAVDKGDPLGIFELRHVMIFALKTVWKLCGQGGRTGWVNRGFFKGIEWEL